MDRKPGGLTIQPSMRAPPLDVYHTSFHAPEAYPREHVGR